MLAKANIPILKKDNECDVCGKCMLVCPNGCISLKVGLINYEPVIDLEKCVKCGKCEKACKDSIKSNNEFNIFENYLCESNNLELIKNSSSGGIFSEIAQYIIKNNGLVVGACYDNNEKKVRHIAISEEKEIKKLRKSKYVQSDTSEMYKVLKDAITKNKLILLTGTPCQIAPIRKKYETLENIICVDLYCHGVMNAGIFANYLNNIEDDLVDIDFRQEGEKGNYYIRYTYANKKIKEEWCEDDLLFRSYIYSCNLKRNCFECEYKDIKHISDITIGDYSIDNYRIPTGFSKHPSIMTINSNVGLKLMRKINKNIKCIKLNDELIMSKYYLLHNEGNKAWDYNLNVSELFINNYIKNGFIKAIHNTLDWEIIEILEKELKNQDCIWIYGTGKMGRRIYKIINDMFPNIVINGFIVSNNQKTKMLYGKNVLFISNVENKDICCGKIFIAVCDKEAQKSIKNNLFSIGLNNICIIGNEY